MSTTPTSASIACLCGKVSARQIQLGLEASIHSPTALSKALCHCDACRSTSGVLCTFYYNLLVPYPDSLIHNSCLKEYAQTTQISRWFCRICGAHVFTYLKPENRYLIAAGLVVTASFAFETECVAVHFGVADTLDGGLSSFLPGSNNDSTSCLLKSAHLQTSSVVSFHAAAPSASRTRVVERDPLEEGYLRAQCHCGGISFAVTRPNDRSKEPWSPWPDLLVPYHSESPKNSEDVKWWLRANDTKYLAGTCACNSCRLASGFPIQCWAFIPKANLINEKGNSPHAFTYGTGTMQRYESSPGVYREFCKTCGATVFWHCDERPGVVDVSVGLLRSATGARAEDWLEWATGRVSFAEDAQDKLLIGLLERGLQKSVK